MTVASAPDSEALDKEAPLRRDIRLLGRILGDTIRSQEGHSVFELVEIVRKTAIRFHRGEEIARSELTEVLAGLSCEGMIPIIRAFSYFSHLANTAEDQHHIRRARLHAIAGSAPRDGTLMLALQRTHKAGIGLAALKEFFTTALICPVLTAHPTEVQRKSTLDREREVATLLAERDRSTSTPEEEVEIDSALRRAILTLWQTSILRRNRLKVIEEVTNGLSYYDYTFLTELPRIYELCQGALATFDPALKDYELPSFFRAEPLRYQFLSRGAPCSGS